MLFEQVAIPRTPFLPVFQGDFDKYSRELTLALTTQVTDLWARAETLDNDSNIQDKVIKQAYIDDLAVGNAQIANLAVTTLKIGLLAVDTAQIAALAITEAKIGALAVTTAKIGLLQVTSATIENLTVGTGKITANAITGITSAYTSGSITCSAETETTVQTCVLTTTGQSVYLTATIQAYISTTPTTNDVLLYRGSTLLAPWYSLMFNLSYTMYTVAFLDVTPAAGDHTYTLRINNVSSTNIYAQSRSMLTMEIKK